MPVTASYNDVYSVHPAKKVIYKDKEAHVHDKVNILTFLKATKGLKIFHHFSFTLLQLGLQ